MLCTPEAASGPEFGTCGRALSDPEQSGRSWSSSRKFSLAVGHADKRKQINSWKENTLKYSQIPEMPELEVV